jgi:hypothetical protein
MYFVLSIRAPYRLRRPGYPSHFRVARWHILKPKITLLGKFLVGLATENGGTFYGHSVYFTAGIAILICLLSFGIFFPFWSFVPRKIWQHWRPQRSCPRFISTGWARQQKRLSISRRPAELCFPGADFISRKVFPTFRANFRRNIRGKFSGMSFEKFPWKIQIFPQISGGKNFRGIFPGIFRGKKSCPKPATV